MQTKPPNTKPAIVNPNADYHAKDNVKARPQGDLIMLGVIAPLAGLVAGLVGALFRLALEEANRFRDALIARMDPWGVGGRGHDVARARCGGCCHRRMVGAVHRAFNLG